MKIYIVVRDVDLGVHVFGTFSTNRKANDAIDKLAKKESARLSFPGHDVVVDAKEFYVLVTELDAACEEL